MVDQLKPQPRILYPPMDWQRDRISSLEGENADLREALSAIRTRATFATHMKALEFIIRTSDVALKVSQAKEE